MICCSAKLVKYDNVNVNNIWVKMQQFILVSFDFTIYKNYIFIIIHLFDGIVLFSLFLPWLLNKMLF